MSDPRSTPIPSDHTGEWDDARPPESGRALARAALYSIVSLAFRAPSEAFCAPLFSRAGHEVVLDAAQTAGGEPLARCAADLFRDLPPVSELAARYRGFFGHTARSDAPPYETEYGDDDLFQQPQELADLAGFAEAFGVRLRPDAGERVDHVSCECEFLAFLASKEAYAIENGDAEMFAATLDAQALFLRDHLARFVPAFAHRLERAEAGGFYARLGRLLLALVTADCERLRVPLGTEQLRIRMPLATALPIGCGSCSELVPGGGEPDDAAMESA